MTRRVRTRAVSGRALRRACAGVVLAWGAGWTASADAQSRATTRRPPATVPAAEPMSPEETDGDSLAVARLTRWTAERFRGSLAIDISAQAEEVARASSRPAPRIETRIGSTRDTVVALHFANALFTPAFRAGQRVRLADPSGITTPLEAQVVARFAFRSPMVPGVDSRRSGGWRHGWAYLVVFPPEVAVASGSGFAGWRVVPVLPETARSTARRTPSDARRSSS